MGRSRDANLRLAQNFYYNDSLIPATRNSAL